jgi:hypothetical protein
MVCCSTRSTGIVEEKKRRKASSISENQRNDPSDVVDVAHVVHPIGFVENEDWDAGESERVPAHEI